MSTPEELRRKAEDLDRQADAELEAIESTPGTRPGTCAGWRGTPRNGTASRQRRERYG
jgi:hypothetical protein